MRSACSYPLLLSILFGLSLSMATAATSAFIADLSARETHGSAMGVLGSVMDIGHTTGPLVSGVVASYFGFGRAFLCASLVIFSAFLGSFAGDQIIFFIGRLKGKEFLGKRPSWNARVEKIHHLLERYQTPIILGFRFVYGFRTITPLAIGMSHVKTGAFILLSWVCDIVVGRIDKTGKMPYSLIAH